MLDTETIKNISTFVEITMQVEERLRGKYEQEAERLNGELQEQVKELEGQKDRQAATIIELKDVTDTQKGVIDTQAKRIKDLEKEFRVKLEMPPAADEELQKKLDKAMDHIRRQGEEIDKLRAGAADPRWIPLTSRYPDMGENVLACTKRGTIYIAQETGEGWKNSTGKMAAPVAWMPLPVRYTGGEA